MSIEREKQVAAEAAAELVESGMTDQPGGVRGHGQVPVPARILRHGGALQFRQIATVWLPVISLNGALFATLHCTEPFHLGGDGFAMVW